MFLRQPSDPLPARRMAGKFPGASIRVPERIQRCCEIGAHARVKHMSISSVSAAMLIAASAIGTTYRTRPSR